MKYLFFTFGLVFFTFQVQANIETYKIDPDHSTIAFNVNHLGFSTISGKFSRYRGSFKYDRDSISNSHVSINITSSSINTAHASRDKHLRSPDFLNAKAFPEMQFESEQIIQIDQHHSHLIGHLKLLGETKKISLEVTHNKEGNNPFIPNNYVAGFSAKGLIKRSDFGMEFALPAIGDEVELLIEIEGIRQEIE